MTPEVHPPITPFYPFNKPGHPIKLFDGLIGGIIENKRIPAVIELRCSPKVGLRWRLQEDSLDDLMQLRPSVGNVDITLRRDSGETTFNAYRSSLTEGWFNGIAIGSASAQLTRVLAHWLNLPALPANILIQGEGEGSWYNGRRAQTLSGWRLTIDRRPDHSTVWRALKEQHTIAVTHVMEIRREDGSSFSANDVKPVLRALQFGLSFALGRWVAPTLPVGLDKNNLCAWEEWGPSLCTQGRDSGLSWWYWADDSMFDAFLEEVINRFSDPDLSFSTQFLLSSAVLSHGTGFLEQRIMTAYSAIEHLSWVSLKRTHRLTNSEFEGLGVTGRMRKLLSLARISNDIDRALPVLSRFAQDEGEDGVPLDGPAAVTRVRNRIVHPVKMRERLYRENGIMREAWLLTMHYLTLLILWEMKYNGNYQDFIPPDRWFGDVEPVPWGAS